MNKGHIKGVERTSEIDRKRGQNEGDETLRCSERSLDRAYYKDKRRM